MTTLFDTAAFILATEVRVAGHSGDIAPCTGSPARARGQARPMATPVRHAGMADVPQHVHGEVARIAARYF